MILEQLGIFGWPERDENLALASLLTGDPMLLIGNHGCAKTLLANKIAEALGKRFVVYDASKAMFEDVLGYPNLEKLKQGMIEYVPSAVTVWDKDLILIDELNRAIPELQSKWLEIIRSRKIMGFETRVKWAWAAMNPMSYTAVQALDEALIGRFALFVYPPDALQMAEADRIRVAMHLNGEDAPALGEWANGAEEPEARGRGLDGVGETMRSMLCRAAVRFRALRQGMASLPEFLAKFADLLMRESRGEIALDGRRLGFLYRNLLAGRSVELAKAEAFGAVLGSFADSARYVVQSSVPIGLTEGSLKREEAVHKLEICFDLLSGYFAEGSPMALVDRVYELFTTDNLLRKVEILLSEDLGDLAKSKAWNDMIQADSDVTVLAYAALQVEARRPGTIPPELLEGLSRRIAPQRLSTDCVAPLEGEAIERIEDIEALLEQESDLGRLVAFDCVQRLAKRPRIAAADVEKARRQIEAGIRMFEQLIANGGPTHGNLAIVA